MILIHNTIKDPFNLWFKYETHFCEELLYQARKKSDNRHLELNSIIINSALLEIEKMLNSFNKSLNLIKGIFLRLLKHRQPLKGYYFVSYKKVFFSISDSIPNSLN